MMRMFCLSLFLILISGASAQSSEQPGIHLMLSGGVAGLALHVHALDIPATTGTPLNTDYVWDFGDPGSPFNQLQGFNAAHLYEKPGSYTVRLYLTEPQTTTRQFTAQVEVRPSTRTTYYVSAQGSDDREGLSPATAIQSLARLQKLIKSDTEFRFRRGDHFDLTQTLNVVGKNIVFASYAYGTNNPQPPVASPTTLPTAPPDDRPRLVYTGPRKPVQLFNLSRRCSDVTIRDITFDSLYSSDDDSKDMCTSIEPAGINAAVIHCRFLNVAGAVNAELAPTGVLVQQCDAPQVTSDGQILASTAHDTTSPNITGLRAYFCWVTGQDIVILGNTVANSTREHCVRIGGGHRMLVSYNDFTNLDRTGVDKLDIAKGTIVAQVGDYLYAAHNTLHDGPAGAGPLNRADLAQDPKYQKDAFQYAVFDSNTLHCPLLLQPGLTHAMIRNNVVYRSHYGAFIITGFDKNYNRGVVDATFAHNTVVIDGDTGYFLGTYGPSEHITIANNLMVAPDIFVRHGSAAMCIQENDLSSFDAITNNVWPSPARGGEKTQGGVIELGNKFSSPEVWFHQPGVSGDQIQNVTLDEKLHPSLKISVPRHPAVPRTMTGVPRGTQTIAGAME